MDSHASLTSFFGSEFWIKNDWGKLFHLLLSQTILVEALEFHLSFVRISCQQLEDIGEVVLEIHDYAKSIVGFHNNVGWLLDISQLDHITFLGFYGEVVVSSVVQLSKPVRLPDRHGLAWPDRTAVALVESVLGA